MSNSFIKRRYNKFLSPRNNYFKDGGNFLVNFDKFISGSPDKNGKLTTGMFKGMSSGTANMIGGAANVAGGIVGSALSNGKTSGVGNALSTASSFASNFGPVGGLAGGVLNTIGGIANAFGGSKLNYENIAKIQGQINNLNNFQSNASSFDTLADQWGNTALSLNFSRKDIGSGPKARKLYKSLVTDARLAAAFAENSMQNSADNLSEDTMSKLQKQYYSPTGIGTSASAAYGGFLNKYDFGGSLNTNGGSFPTGLTFINEGGTHESNPNEGVPMGIGENGMPNLVEQGEVIYKDPTNTNSKDGGYVFSNRITVPKGLRGKYKLRGEKGLSFADAAEQLAKTFEERPNDPISKDTLHEIMGDLTQAQESIKAERQQKLLAKLGELQSPQAQPGLPQEQMPQEQMQPEQSEQGAQSEQPMQTNFAAYGGNLYGDGGKKLAYFKTKADIENNLPWLKQMYVSGNNTSAWDRLFDSKGNIIASKGGNTGLYDPNGAYMKSLNSLSNDSWSKWSEEQKNSFVNSLKQLNPNVYSNYTIDNIGSGDWSWENLKSLATDGYVGGHHHLAQLAAANNLTVTQPTAPTRMNRYFLRGTDASGNPTVSNLPVTPWDGRNEYGRTFEDDYKNKYTFVDKAERPVDNNNTIYTDYYYDPVKEEEKQVRQPLDLGRESEWQRYVTPFTLLGHVATDGLGLTNTPDYQDAARIEGFLNSGNYMPIAWNSIPNKLAYKPYDRDHWVNMANASAGAARRGIMNQSGGNSGRAIAGLLAADYNAQSKLGDLYTNAEEYNWKRRQEVEDFNRATNQANSTGMLQADQANQSAYASSKQAVLNGVIEAAKMRWQERQAAEAARSTNLSGLLDSLGGIGAENHAMNNIRLLAEIGAFGGLDPDHPLAQSLNVNPTVKKSKRTTKEVEKNNEKVNSRSKKKKNKTNLKLTLV